MKKAVLAVLGVALIAVLVWFAIVHEHFDVRSFWNQLRHASPAHIAAGAGMIYVGFIFRSWRWAVFLRPGRKLNPFALIGTQFIGFSAVALFGRLADLSRPYLIARKTKTQVASQIAVYAVERMFDLGAAALIFSAAFAFAPKDMPHHEAFRRVGLISLLGTVGLAAIAVAIRISGRAVAGFARSIVGKLSANIGEALADRILAFREGLSAISSVNDFLSAALMSLAMWGLIAGAYVQAAHAFTNEPTLAHLSFSQAMLLMAVSIGGSAIQLPILGWFTQIAITSTAIHATYGTPVEAATGCGALLLIITFLSVIPGGFIFSQIEDVSLRSVTQSAEAIDLEHP